MASTTIRVSRQLHDRLAARASAGETTLAGAIERALDAEDATAFWESARRTMADPAGRQRLAAEADRLGGTLREGIDPSETWDDVL